MAVINLEPLQGDAPVIDDGSLYFNGGQFSNNRASKLEANQFFAGENTDIDQLGSNTTRRGSNKLGTSPNSTRIQGLAYYDTPATELLLQISNTSFYEWNGTSWSNAISGYTASSATLEVNFAQLVDKIYWTDGSGLAYRYDGTTIQASSAWGIGTQPPTGSKFVVEHRNRLIWGGDPTTPQTVYPSDVLDPNTPASNAIQIGKGDGDAITGYLSWIQDSLLVFKERSIHVVDISGGVGANATIQKIHGTIGCVSHRSIKQIGADSIGQDVFFLTKDGVRSVLTTVQDGQQGITPPLSFPINDIIQRINWTFANTANAVYWNNRYMLAVPLDSAQTPNYVLVYHVINKSWSGYWVGWSPTIFCISAFSGDLRLNFGQTDGKVLQWLDYIPENSTNNLSYQDDAIDIVTSFDSKAYIFNNLQNKKLGYSMEIEFYQSKAIVDVLVQIDGQTPTIALSGFDTNAGAGFLVPFTLPLTIGTSGIKRATIDLMRFGEFREMQIIVQATAAKVALKTIQLMAFLRQPQTISS